MFVSTKSKTTLVLTYQDRLTVATVKGLLDTINEAFSENPKIGYLPYDELFDLILKEDNFYKEEG